MGLKRKQKIEPIKEEKSAVDEVFDRRKRIKADFSFRKAQPLLFILAVCLGLIVIAVGYYFSPVSKVKSISIKNNYYLDKDYIKELSGLTLENRYYLVIDYFVEKKLEESELIKNATVKHKDQGVIEITIEEETPFGYRYLDVGEILLTSGKAVELKSEYLDIIAKVPYIDGFETEEQLERIAKAFQKVDRSIIESISEVSQYPMSYDENTLRLFMRDGNNFFASYYSLSTVNSYNEIASDFTESGLCIYSDDSLKVAFTSTCPWNLVAEEKEYWIDELGNIVVNQYGDPVEKKYFTNDQGEFILDGNGNKILIPMGQEDDYEAYLNNSGE
ncbi:cell division protein FtsQ/DivIB [Anaerorhabdus furcosa]|uniref:Cell division septal protein FtsQ n=1 Tax=Anaerorhabdus furcosa TaxID=118967 RepID=A0A1T4Q3T4_9FIRM|nr:FtsQ-type POTRA domain-containing protein [Anaerorhabdus furcosa]SJZ98485.1 Cell division septal protein FtsQ [Anaerorhabdus furcosa]